ncbi:MAG TPA: protocatechuate 3,4-dioxygenase [Ramlibacter sp.]|nr:protocatechuate 3,4-dioxygenase [Ramlibacter sp.]
MPPLSRRTLSAALVALPACWTGARAQQAAARRATPAQTEGPFYPVTLPRDTDADLLRNGNLQYTQGQPAWVEGVVTDLQGKPVAGATVEIWQCDQAGHYHHPGDGGRADPNFQGFGRVTVGSDGRYRFRTIRPVAYSGRTPHIHVKVKLDRRELLTTQLYVEGDPHNERDSLWRRLGGEERALLTVPFRAGSEGLQASFTIVVAT